MNRQTDSVMAAIALMIAALATWLVLEWRGRQPVEPADAAQIARQSDEISQALSEALDEDIAAQARDEQRERLESPLGQALARNCLEWETFHDNHPDASAAEQRDQACAEYREYVASGLLPGDARPQSDQDSE